MNLPPSNTLPTQGYRELDSSLRTESFGRQHEHHASLGSTNDRAWELLRLGAPTGTLVTADGQTSGRGRRGRVWVSDTPEDIYASLLLSVERGGPEQAQQLGALGLAVALGLRRGLSETLQLGSEPSELASCRNLVGIKWPNDLWVGGRKLGGILCESRWEETRIHFVVGFGLNVWRREFDGEQTKRGTSLAAIKGMSASEYTSQQRDDLRACVLANVLLGLEQVLTRFWIDGFAPLQAEFNDVCVLRGQLADLDSGQRCRVVGVECDGSLLVREESGRLTTVHSGEVSIRPTVGR